MNLKTYACALYLGCMLLSVMHIVHAMTEVSVPTSTPAPTPSAPAPAPTAVVAPAPAPAAPVAPAAAPAPTVPPQASDQSPLATIAALGATVAKASNLTPQADRDAVLTGVQKLILATAKCTDNELEQLDILMTKISASKYILAKNQHPTFALWQDSVKDARELVDPGSVLFASLKKILTPPAGAASDWPTAVPEDQYTRICKAVRFSVALLAENVLDPVEKDQSIDQSVAGLVARNLPILFNARGGKKAKATKALYRAMFLALKQGFDKAITKQQAQMAYCCMWLTQAAEAEIASKDPAVHNVDYMAKLRNCREAIKLLASNGYEYEKQLLMSQLATVYVNRERRALAELNLFATLLTTLIGKKQLVPADLDICKGYQPYIQACIALTKDYATIDKAIAAYKPLLPLIGKPGATAERNLFTVGAKEANIPGILAKLFTQAMKGTTDQKKALAAFFQEVKQAPGVLTPGQVPAFDVWLTALKK